MISELSHSFHWLYVLNGWTKIHRATRFSFILALWPLVAKSITTENFENILYVSYLRSNVCEETTTVNSKLKEKQKVYHHLTDEETKCKRQWIMDTFYKQVVVLNGSDIIRSLHVGVLETKITNQIDKGGLIDNR